MDQEEVIVDTRSNVIIVGGGAIGLCSAYYLLQAGIKATVIDKGEMGHGSSLHNAGYISPSHFVPLAAPGIIAQGLKWMLDPVSPFYVKPRFDPAFMSWAWKFRKSCTHANVKRSAPLLRDLSNASSALFEEMSRLPGMDFEFTKNGLLILFRTEKGRETMMEESELAHKLGVGSLFLERQDVQKLVPETEVRAAGALYFPHDRHVTPAKFVASLTRHLEEKGVTLLPQTTVTAFATSGKSVTAVRTKENEIAADYVVIAGGAWSPGIVSRLGLSLPVQAGKGYSVTIPRPDKKPLIPMILSEARVALTPMGDTFRAAGTMEIAGIDLSINQRRVHAILAAIPEYIGGFVPDDFLNGQVWAGLRPVSPDGVPFIGPFRKYPNVIAATGHAMLGITLAHVTGKIVSDCIHGADTGYPMKQLSPDRF
jgi:D-amino-acid dehydrogenase